MEFTLGFSPCPNDTFIFDALVNGKIDTGGLSFIPLLEDVQTLNQWAIEDKLDISKISYGVLPLVLNQYKLLSSGGALGNGVGPLLIARTNITDLSENIKRLNIAIPGENTTAHLLFSFAFPQAHKKHFMVFNKIEDAVANATVDAGVIIHENRFTYQNSGLIKLMDLGEHWEQKTGSPIPLGGIVAKNNIDSKLHAHIDNLIRKSLEYSFENYPEISSYVSAHSQAMSEDVMRQHIDLYVNDFSLDIGAVGRAAVKNFLEVYAKMNGTAVESTPIFNDLAKSLRNAAIGRNH